MSRTRTAVLALLASMMLLAACDEDRRAISRDDLPDVPAEPTVSIEIDDDGFSEDTLEVTTLDLVEFRNVGEADHGVRTDDYAIDTGPLFPDEFTLVVFDEPGEYTIVDTEDDDASMTVTVSEGPAPASTAPG